MEYYSELKNKTIEAIKPWKAGRTLKCILWHKKSQKRSYFSQHLVFKCDISLNFPTPLRLFQLSPTFLVKYQTNFTFINWIYKCPNDVSWEFEASSFLQWSPSLQLENHSGEGGMWSDIHCVSSIPLLLHALAFLEPVWEECGL
jgi:hypothetical protein